MPGWSRRGRCSHAHLSKLDGSVFAPAQASRRRAPRQRRHSCEVGDEHDRAQQPHAQHRRVRRSPSASTSRADASTPAYGIPHAEPKTKIHRTCIARLGNAFLNLEGSDELGRRVREIVVEELNAEEAPLSPNDRAELEQQIAADILGYGPLEPFLQDTSITEVMVNGSDQVFVERGGKIEETRRRSSTTRTCSASSTGSSRRWAGGSTRRRRWSTRAFPTAAASTRSSRRSARHRR